MCVSCSSCWTIEDRTVLAQVLISVCLFFFNLDSGHTVSIEIEENQL